MAKKTASRSRSQSGVAKAKTTSRRTASSRKSSAKSSRRSAASKADPSVQIGKLDAEILKLINQRASLTTESIEKDENGHVRVYDPQADDELWTRLAKDNPGPLSDQTVRGVFRQIVSAARAKVKTQRVAYLGPPYSFTHLAATERFGESADLVPVTTIASVFEEVNRGHAHFGLVPIENSTDGRIIDTLDMFRRLPLRICGEVQVSIHHNLLARCPRSQITQIYSRPQALSQCRDWLARNMPQAKLVEMASTSAAAQLAQQTAGAAAVASHQAATQYGLDIVSENIEDSSKNVTRFAVIGDEAPEPTGSDRTSLLLQIPHKPGSLSDTLQVFAKNKLNLTWIESFPLRDEEGYLFFIDFEGHSSDTKPKRTINELAKGAVTMKVLGSYPRSDVLN